MTRTRALLLVLGLGLAGGAASPTALAAEKPDVQLLVAEEQVRQGHTDAALSTLTKILKAAPDHADAHILYQTAVTRAGALEAATAEYRLKAEAAPESALYAFLYTRLLPARDAARAFQQQQKQFPDSPWPHAGHAAALESQGELADAMAAHSRAVSLAPKGETRFLRGQARGFELASEWGLAAGAWRKVKSLAPDDVQATAGLGSALRRDGEVADAEELLKAGLAKSPRSVMLLHQLALVHFDAEAWGECLARVEEAIKLNPRAAAVLTLGAEATLKQAQAAATKARLPIDPEHLAPAVKYAQRAVDADPSRAHSHIVLGTVHETLGDLLVEHLRPALEAYEAALERLPPTGADRVRALTSKAYVLASLGEHSAAVKAAEEALDLDKEHVPALLHAGHATVLRGKAATAIPKYYKKAIKLDRENPGAHHSLGLAYWANKKAGDALKAFERAIELDPDDGRFRLSIGELHYEARRYDEAVAALYTATELRPADAVTWAAYARAVTATEEFEEAAKAYEKALELDPERNDDRLFLGLIYDRLEEDDKARAVIKTYMEKGGEPDKSLGGWVETLLEDDA